MIVSDGLTICKEAVKNKAAFLCTDNIPAAHLYALSGSDESEVFNFFRESLQR